MLIRQAAADEMLNLWNENVEALSPTAEFFRENIESGNAEFWTAEMERELIGELYIFKNLPDKDFANGKKRAYLCAFRIKKEYRGQGIGSRLMEYVLNDLKARGFTEVTIGVEECETDNIRLYQRFGFDRKIKDCCEDPCMMDENGKPAVCGKYWLLEKQLSNSKNI